MNSKQIKEVISVLQKVEAKGNENFNIGSAFVGIMGEGEENCVASWYGISKFIEWQEPQLFRNWSSSADIMAKDLGFKSYPDLVYWAEKHWFLWGNKSGKFMFGNIVAYNDFDPRFPMTSIIKHWESVLFKIKLLERFHLSVPQK